MKVLKWVMAILAILIGILTISRMINDARVVDEISSNPQGQRAAIVMSLTFQDGKQIPVNYLREGEQVFVGADGPWWRSFTGEGQPVSLLIQGEHLTGQARTILDDQAYTDEIFARLRPTVPEWLPDWANGKLIVIDLETMPDTMPNITPDSTPNTTKRTALDNVLTSEELEEGWQLLFDGETIAHWRSYQAERPNPRWVIEDHALTLSGGGGGDLVTTAI